MLSSKAHDHSPEMLHKLCMYRKSNCVSCVQAASAIGNVDTSNVGGGVKYGMGLLRMLWRDGLKIARLDLSLVPPFELVPG